MRPFAPGRTIGPKIHTSRSGDESLRWQSSGAPNLYRNLVRTMLRSMLRSTTILTGNVIFAAAKSSNPIARLPLLNSVKLPLETTGGSDFLPRSGSSDSATRQHPEGGQSIPAHLTSKLPSYCRSFGGESDRPKRQEIAPHPFLPRTSQN